MSQYGQTSKKNAVIFWKVQLKEVISKEKEFLQYFDSVNVHFFPCDTTVNSVLDRRETLTGLLNDFLLVHPESPAELPDSD